MARAMPNPIPGKQYTIQDENSLSQVARRAYGNGNNWPVIWRANQSTLRSSDPDLIFPGEVIFIPELAELLRAEPAITNKEPDELTIVLDGLLIRTMNARVLLTMDTPSDGWTCEIQWIPGDNPELDKRIKPFTYTPAKIYIGGELVLSGYCYDCAPSTSENGTTLALAGFSKTIDFVDSNLKPPYEENNVTLKQRAEKLVKSHGIKVVIEADTGGAFDRVTATETDTGGTHINKLAFQRGVLVSNTSEGDLLLHEADTESKPIATLEEGQPPVLDYKASFKGRLRFGSYRAIGSTPKENVESIVIDKKVPRSRNKTIRVGDVLAGEIETVAKWERNKVLVNTLTIPVPVAGWLDPSGNLWKPNTIVTLTAPSIFVPNGFNFTIRSVEFSEKDNEKTAILNLIPPNAYTKKEIIEPWD